MSGQRGWPWPADQAHGRTQGGGGVCRLAVAIRTGSVPIGWAVTLNWGCPADRTVERSAMSVARPANAGCPQEDWSAETVSRRVSGGRTLVEAGGQPDCGHVRDATGEVLEVPTRRSRVGCAGRRAAPARKPASAADRADGRLWRRGGQWVSVSGSRSLALAGRGSARRRVVPSRRENRSACVAAIEPASRIQGTHPVSEPDSTSCPFTRPY
jgi:hypothetical protein